MIILKIRVSIRGKNDEQGFVVMSISKSEVLLLNCASRNQNLKTVNLKTWNI